MFNWNKKEKPLQGLMGVGGGATGYLVGGGGGSVGIEGGNETEIGSYKFYEFTTGMPGTFTVNGSVADAVILIAGGGGSGGCQVGGGGGAGGLIFRTGIPLTPGSYGYSIGAGGVAVAMPTSHRNGYPGGDSTLSFPGSHPYGAVTNRAKGGGAGGGHQTPGAQPGGSGGGGGAPPTNGGQGIQTQQVNPGWDQYGGSGGSGRDNSWAGGGGGGAGGTGGPSPGPHNGGYGANGRNFPQIPPAFGENSYFCGGGGGGRNQNQGNNGDGGAGGGGNGAGDEGVNPMDNMHGDDKTGGGGGGRRDSPEGSGRGGTGVIIIRIPA